jgi:hypothetical protein
MRSFNAESQRALRCRGAHTRCGAPWLSAVRPSPKLCDRSVPIVESWRPPSRRVRESPRIGIMIRMPLPRGVVPELKN